MVLPAEFVAADRPDAESDAFAVAQFSAAAGARPGFRTVGFGSGVRVGCNCDYAGCRGSVARASRTKQAVDNLAEIFAILIDVDRARIASGIRGTGENERVQPQPRSLDAGRAGRGERGGDRGRIDGGQGGLTARTVARKTPANDPTGVTDEIAAPAAFAANQRAHVDRSRRGTIKVEIKQGGEVSIGDATR